MLNYWISDRNIKDLKTEKDVITLLMKHSFESFVFSVRTAEFNFAISKEMGFNDKLAEMYFLCGLYHDVGKVGMSKFLIDFPGRYTEEMREEMKKHTNGGSILLEKTSASDFLIETAKYHHCNYDGTGYTEHLSKEQIPLHARMTRISDSADAYLSTRSYKEGYKVSGLYDDLLQFSGTWYDPKIIDALKRVHDKIIQHVDKNPEELTQDEYMYFMKKIYGIDKVAEEHLFGLIRNA
jgi:HD-GYP domain-containing protein (c-di-GMP phosphodiesterase class II)